MANKTIVTTSWDDNPYENLKMVKLLDKYCIKGTFYVNSNADDMGRSLRNEKIRQMVLDVASSGHEIGSHTVNHVVLTKCRNPEKELEQCKNDLEKLTKHEVDSFSYPRGVYDDRVRHLVEKAGYSSARTTKYMTTSYPSDPYEWGISLHASNSSPRITFVTWCLSRVSPKALLDWEIRAKLLLDLTLRKGGIWHIWGHSWEIDQNRDWQKLERVLQYISRRRGVSYVTNREIFKPC